MKKKIALIIDSRGWAFDNIAKNLKKRIDEYEIDIIPGDIFEGNMIRLFLLCKDYDLIHFMWRGYLSLIKNYKEYVYFLGMDFSEFEKKYIFSKNITFTVCDELYISGEEKGRTDEVMKYANDYFVTSKKLFDIYSQFDKKPNLIIHDGVSLEEFIPKNLERFENMNRNIVIGWAGNSKFTDSDGDSDMKGVEGIIKPAIEELKKQNYNISLKLADRNIKKTDIKDMPQFYNAIDIYVCASKAEGTPMTILEAMASGIPVVTTDVGIVQEAFGNLEKEFILEERTQICLVNKIKKLIDTPNKMKLISEENLEKIKVWDWKTISTEYKNFFKKSIKK